MCRPHRSLTQELNALDAKKAVVAMSVIDNSSASHTNLLEILVQGTACFWCGGKRGHMAQSSWIANWCQNLGAAALNTQNSLAVMDF